MKMLWLSIKTQFRVPVSIFFSLIFPIVMMVIMLLSYGNFSIGNGFHFIDKYFLISTSIGLIPITLISFPIWIGSSLENNTYKRLNYFGINIEKMMVADVISYCLIAFLSVFVNIIVALIFFKLHLPSVIYFLSYLGQMSYCIFGLLLFGTWIGLVVKNTKIILPLGMILLFTIYMFIGVFVQFDQLPESIRKLSVYIPVKYAANDFFEIWAGNIFVNTKFLIVNTVVCLLFATLIVSLKKSVSFKKG